MILYGSHVNVGGISPFPISCIRAWYFFIYNLYDGLSDGLHNFRNSGSKKRYQEPESSLGRNSIDLLGLLHPIPPYNIVGISPFLRCQLQTI